MSDLPKGWEKLPLGTYSKLQNGHAFKSEEFKDTGIPVLRISNIKNGWIDFSTVTYVEPREISENFVVCDKDILIAMSGATTGKVGRFRLSSKAYLNQRVGKLLTKNENKLLKDYIYYVVTEENFQRDILIDAIGGAQPNISSGQVESFTCFLPPVEEQTKIAEILTSVDDVIELTEKEIETLQMLKKGMMQDLLTKGIGHTKFKDSSLGQIPEGWDIQTIQSVGKIKGRVGWKGYTVADLRDEGPITIGAKNITKHFQLDLQNKTHLSVEKYEESPEIMVSIDDVLIVQRGTIGGVALVDMEIGRATINPSMAILSSIKCNPKFVFYWLTSPIGQQIIRDNTSQTGVPMISQKQIKEILVPLPSQHEQELIVDKLNAADKAIDAKMFNLKKFNYLKKALMSDLLTGKVRVKV